MYITKIKNKAEFQNNSNNLIDALFAGDVVNESTIPSKFVRTRTTIGVEPAPRNFINNCKEMNQLISEFLRTHEVESMYSTFKIPKKSGGFRTIDAPNEELKLFMSEVTRKLRYKFSLLTHDSAFAYVKNRSVVDALKEHHQNKSKWFLKIDLKDFFGSCNKEFICRQLKQIYPFACLDMPVVLHLINNIAELATLNDKLPQGTPLSPALTNWIMMPYDYHINVMLNSLVHLKLITKQRYVYTRYADDIIISAKTKFEMDVIIERLEKLFKASPLTINKDKIRFGSSSGRNWNLGIMLNKDNKLTVGHKRKRYLKSMIYNFILAKDEWDKEQCRWLQGNLAWLENVEPEYYKGLMSYYKKKYDINIRKEIKLKLKNN